MATNSEKGSDFYGNERTSWQDEPPGGGGSALRAIGNSFASQFAGRKSRAALAVSLWIANGGVASAVTTDIDLDESGNVRWFNDGGNADEDYGTATASDGGTTLNIGGSWRKPTNHTGYNISARYSNDINTGYTLNVNGATFNNVGSLDLWGTNFSNNSHNNKVIISNSKIIGGATIRGSYIRFEGTIDNCSVTIAGALGDDGKPLTSFSGGSQYVIAGYSNAIGGTKNISNNAVNLYGAAAMESVSLRGRDTNGTLGINIFENNELHLGGTKDGATVNGIAFSPWQGYAADSTTVNNTVKQVSKFNKIVLHQVKWDTDIPALKATDGITFENTPALDISGMTFANDTTAGTMTLLEGTSGNFNTLSLTYSGGTAALDSTTSSQIVKTEADKTSAESGVTLGYDTTHTVALADTSKVTYTIGNDVKSISFGEMTWGTARDASAAGYNYASVTDANIDASKLTFTNPDAVAANSSETLLKANNTLTAMAESVAKDVSYSYSPVDGVTVSGIINGTLSKSVTDIQYTATANNATKLTFGNVKWKDSGALMTRPTNITFAGANVDTSNINFTNIQSLEANKQMTLVANFDGNGSETFTGTKYKVGSTLQGQGKASLDENNTNLIFTAETAVAPPPSPTPSSDDNSSSNNSNSGNSNNNYYYNTNTNNNNNTNNNTNNNNSNSNSSSGGNLVLEVQEQTHNTVMGAMAGMAALSAGNDFIGAATDGLALASNIGADGISSYANMGGGNMRQETGSHVDTHTWNAIIALGHKNEKERGSLEYGAFFEYGTGNYTTFNGDERGDGSSHYTGGGVLAKWTAKHGLYVEGSLRAGRVHDDARNVLRDASGMPYSYTTNANYFGFHVGVGKEITLNNGNIVDVYGKFFYNRRNGVSFDAGGHYDLDAVTSKIVRVGARYTIKSEKWDIYAGAAYEHELDGKAAGKADGLSIRGADTSGGSFRGELGATVTPDKNVPVKLDFNLTGFAGKKRGFSGGVSVALMF